MVQYDHFRTVRPFIHAYEENFVPRNGDVFRFVEEKPVMPKKVMGKLNAGWGVCGATSSLHALYEHDSAHRSTLGSSGQTASRLLAEIKTYLRLLQAENSNLLQDIETFTQSFGGPYSNFTVDEYIQKVNSITTESKQGLQRLHSVQDEYDIAFPPAAVVDYLQRMCGFNGAKIDNKSNANEMILGVSEKGGGNTMYNGLIHYLYLHSGTIYSWGDKFRGTSTSDSVHLAGRSQHTTYIVSWKIVPGRWYG